MSDSEQIHLASQPHERLLFNLSVVHFLLPALLFATQNLWLIFCVPAALSIAIVLSIAVEAYRPSKKTDLVLTHWWCAWKRGQYLLLSYGVSLLLFLLSLALVQLQPDTTMRHIQLAVLSWFCLIPISVTLAALIFLETTALYRARQGKIPERIFRF